MSDALIELGENRTARRVVQSLGLPIPLPQKLARNPQPWLEQPLADRDVFVHAHGELTDVLAHALAGAGANSWVSGDVGTFSEHGEAWGRPAHVLDDAEGLPKKAHALILDASGLRSPEQLRELYDFFHPRMRGLGTCGRLVVLGRPHAKIGDPAHAATQRALTGFVKSCGREVGKNGATANLVTVHEGAEDRVESVLRFLLSERSAFISGQVFECSKTIRASKEVTRTRTLDGKTALVTGAARGIGASIARTLAREGAHVVCVDIPSADALLAKVAEDIGGTVLLLDVTAEDAAEQITAAAAEHGGLDIAVHNAGVTRDKTLKNMKPALWDMTLGINLTAVANLCSEVPLNTGGRIVLLSSIAGIAGNLGQTNYSASKAGVIGLTESLGKKLARRGVAVNAVAPGFIETRLTKAIPTATREVARRMNNLSQGGLPQDIAETVAFLSSPGAHALCGQVLRVCGGNLVGA